MVAPVFKIIGLADDTRMELLAKRPERDPAFQTASDHLGPRAAGSNQVRSDSGSSALPPPDTASHPWGCEQPGQGVRYVTEHLWSS